MRDDTVDARQQTAEWRELGTYNGHARVVPLVEDDNVLLAEGQHEGVKVLQVLGQVEDVRHRTQGAIPQCLHHTSHTQHHSAPFSTIASYTPAMHTSIVPHTGHACDHRCQQGLHLKAGCTYSTRQGRAAVLGRFSVCSAYLGGALGADKAVKQAFFLDALVGPVQRRQEHGEGQEHQQCIVQDLERHTAHFVGEGTLQGLHRDQVRDAPADGVERCVKNDENGLQGQKAA